MCIRDRCAALRRPSPHGSGGASRCGPRCSSPVLCPQEAGAKPGCSPSGRRPGRRRGDQRPPHPVLELTYGGPVTGRKRALGDRGQYLLLRCCEIVEKVEQPDAVLDRGPGIVAGDRQAQTTERLERLRLAVAHQRRRPLRAEHGQSGEPRLLLAADTGLHTGEPFDEARDERTARAPAPPGRRASKTLELLSL